MTAPRYRPRMPDPLQLELGLLVEPAPPAVDTIEARFEAFHEANPWVLDALETLAADLHARGRTRIGIGMLFEVLRWYTARSTTEEEAGGYRLNNNHRSRYARLILSRHPEWAGLFQTRELRAA